MVTGSTVLFVEDGDYCWTRLVFTMHPEYRHDVIFLTHAGERFSKLSQAGEKEAREVYDTDFQLGRILIIPSSLCEVQPTYLVDVCWRRDVAGVSQFNHSDLNASMRYLRVNIATGTVELEPMGANDIAHWARLRFHLLRQRGAVPVTAVVVQTFDELFIPGTGSAFSAVLFSFDKQVSLEILPDLADALFDARDSKATPEPHLAAAVEFLRAGVRGDVDYHGRLLFHPRQAAGREMCLAKLWIHRPFLKAGFIRRPYEPLTCLAVPGVEGGIELCPDDPNQQRLSW
jgi:hypothetical protein